MTTRTTFLLSLERLGVLYVLLFRVAACFSYGSFLFAKGLWQGIINPKILKRMIQRRLIRP